jgi:hypothetical protein
MRHSPRDGQERSGGRGEKGINLKRHSKSTEY